MSGNSSKNKKKPVAGSFIPYETGYVNIAGETFFLSMGPTEPGAFELTDDSLKTDAAFDLLFLGGTSKTFTDAEKATLQRVIRAIFGAGKSITKKGLRLPCSKEEGELLIRSLLYRRSILMDEIASYDELLAADVHARYLRDHLDRLNKLIDEDVPQTIAPCKDTALVDPNKPAKVVGLDDDRMLKLLEIFAYLLAQGYDPIEVLGKKLPQSADILTRMAQKNAPLLRDYETEFERERGSGKRPQYTRTLIKIKKVLEDDSELLAAIAPEEALSALSDIEDKLKINPTHKGTIKERRDGIIGAIDTLQKALATALAEVQRLQAENDQLKQDLVKANLRIKELEADIAKKEALIKQLETDLAAEKAISADLRKQLDAEKAISADLRKQLDAAKAEIAQLKKDLAAAQAEVARLTAELAKAQAEITRLQGVIKGLEAQIAQLQADLVAAREQIRTLQADVQRLTDELAAEVEKYAELFIKYYELERELKDTKALLSEAVKEIAYWMSIRDEYEALLRDALAAGPSGPAGPVFGPNGPSPADIDKLQKLLDQAIQEIAYWMSIRDEYEAYVQRLVIQMEAMVQEIAFWMNLSDEYYVLITDMFVVIDQMLLVITDSLDLLNEYGQLVDDYGAALSAVVNENEELREQIADLIQDKQYILQLLTYIWESLGAFIDRMRGQGLILPGEYPALDNGTLETLHDSTTTLNTFLEGVQMPAPPAAAGNTNASMLCMLNTLYFILISQMDPAVEPSLLELYRALQPGEIDLIIKVFYKLVFAIKKNLRRVPNPIENWGDTIDEITLRLQDPIIRLSAHEDRVISVFETFINDPDFFKKDYSDGDQVIKEDKHNSTLMTYMFFLAVLAGTLHTPENQRILNEFGCSVAGPLEDVVPPPPPPPPPASHTLTLVTNPENTGRVEGASNNLDDGATPEISWNADGTPYTFNHWEGPVENPDIAQTTTQPITENTTIIAHLAESAPPPPPPPPPPPVPVTTEQLCKIYKELFYRVGGEPQHEPRFLDRQEAFRAQFSPEQFALIERMCHPVEKQYARARGPEVLRPQALLTGTSAAAIGSKAPAYIPEQPVPRGLGAITRRGGRRHRSGNVTRKRRAH